MPIGRAILRLCLAIGLACAPVLVFAQNFPVQSSTVLTIEQDVLFQSTLFGKRVKSELESESASLQVIKRQIEADLGAEEVDLTEQRKTLDPQEFRKIADAFDEKVQAIRAAQDAKTREFNQILDRERARFLNLIVPIIGDIMVERGAVIVLNRRTVFISANSVDITQEAVRRINEIIGDGAIQSETPSPKE